jgi:hypothetical protein
MPTKQGNKIIHGKSHENHKHNQMKATVQGNIYIYIKKKKVHANRPHAENRKQKGHWKLIAVGMQDKA